MKSAMRMRHWCDHCRKAGAIAKHMLKHEAGCTLNPERVCRMCDLLGEVQKPMAELAEALSEGGFKGLQHACAECPACTLATLRQTNHGGQDPDNVSDDGRYSFDFKTAAAEFWRSYNDEHRPSYGDL